MRAGGCKIFQKEISEGTLIRDLRVHSCTPASNAPVLTYSLFDSM